MAKSDLNSSHEQSNKKNKSWIILGILAIVILSSLLGLRSCRSNPEAVPTIATTALPPTTPSNSKIAILLPNGVSAVGAFLSGNEVLPRTFVFEKINFETGKSEIREADRAEIALLGEAMEQNPRARIRIIGYADARGDASANSTLAKNRAESVKAALIAAGINGRRLETASGGETDPVESNATASGQAENRRTEIVILER